MRQFVILIFCSILLISCSSVETASNENKETNLNKTVLKTPTPSPTTKSTLLLKPINPKVKLNAEQTKYLNESLPRKVREILEKAEKIEILAEVLGENDYDSREFSPNRIAIIIDEKDKKEVLETFYRDASAGLNASACYIPHHGIRATYQGRTVEIEICYQCHLFAVNSPFGEFNGGLPFESQKSEDVLNRIIKNQSVEIEK